MGAGSSSEAAAAVGTKNTELAAFVGTQSFPYDDAFWDALLSFSIQISAETITKHEAGLAKLIAPYGRQLAENNLTTNNLSTLLRLACTMLSEQPRDQAVAQAAPFPLKLYNALLLVRSFLAYFVSVLPSETLALQMTDDTANQGFVLELMDFCCTCGVWPSSYVVHLEALTCFEVLLSPAMFTTVQGVANNPFLPIILDRADRAGGFVTALLMHYVKQFRPLEPPKERSYWDITTSIITGTASTLFLFPVHAYSYFTTPTNDVGAPLADRSALLLLVLAGHTPEGMPNPYRNALCQLHNVDAVGEDGAPLPVPATAARMSYSALYKSLCTTLTDERSTLLLYYLLHDNAEFAAYVLGRDDVGTLVVPLLKMLYEADERRPHTTYMLLIVLLMLSQEKEFNEKMHASRVAQVPWFVERILTDVSVGGLMVIVLVRAIQLNLAKSRDMYLHTNCLATLANMANYFSNIHSYPAQRILSLFDLLAKKYKKLTAKHGEPSVGAEPHKDVKVYTEFLATVLELINATINVLPANPQFVYALLHRRELFDSFRNHPQFHTLIINIDNVLRFFVARVLPEPQEGIEMEAQSVEEVLANIVKAIGEWDASELRQFPELKFKYEEVPTPMEFFTPYVWSLVYTYDPLPWPAARVRLFEIPVEVDEFGDEVVDKSYAATNEDAEAAAAAAARAAAARANAIAAPAVDAVTGSLPVVGDEEEGAKAGGDVNTLVAEPAATATATTTAADAEAESVPDEAQDGDSGEVDDNNDSSGSGKTKSKDKKKKKRKDREDGEKKKKKKKKKDGKSKGKDKEGEEGDE